MKRFIRIAILLAFLLSISMPAIAAAPIPPTNPRLVLFEAFLRPNG